MEIPRSELTGKEIYSLVKKLRIPNFRGVFCADEIPHHVDAHQEECAILNFQKHTQTGSHWVAWYRKGSSIVYYDSYGGSVPPDLVTYLRPHGWIKRSIVITQRGPTECGGLCLLVLQSLTRGRHFGKILTELTQRVSDTPLHGMEEGTGKGDSSSSPQKLSTKKNLLEWSK